MRESFRPVVQSNESPLIGHGALPKPEHPSYAQMVRGEADCRLVTVRALVRSASLVPELRAPTPTAYLRHDSWTERWSTPTSTTTDENALKGLLGAEVEITGVEGGIFDHKMQMTGILLHMPSMAWVKILKRAGSDPWSLPVTPMDRILVGLRVVDLSQRMRVRGTITYYQPGTALVLQDGRRSLWIPTTVRTRCTWATSRNAIGFPSVENGSLTLTGSEVRDSLVRAPVTPTLFTRSQLSLGSNNGRNHAFDLVSVEGQVVTEVRQATQDEYVLDSDGRLFSAILSHPRALNLASLSPMKEVPIGHAHTCHRHLHSGRRKPLKRKKSFNILMRGFDDIVVVARPPWLNVLHLTLIVGLLLAFVIALGMRGWYTERRNRRQIGSLAYVEQRRARILEDINHSKPLAEILERITELVSLRLNGAPCWCQVTDGATLGNRPPRLHSASLRTVERRIRRPLRPAARLIFAAFDARTKPTAEENDALAMAAGLATLAIETSRLYSDLVHRSEFDLLTDVQNRFAMEKSLRAHDSMPRVNRPASLA